MRSARSWVALGSAGLAMSAAIAALGSPAATAAGGSHHTPTQKSVTPARERSKPQGKVATSSKVKFDLVLSLRHAKQARSFVRKVSSPGSASFHHYLSDAQWEHRYGPSHAQVSAAKTWLRSHGFAVGSVPSTRLFVTAHGTAGQVERAFSTQLGYYQVNGHTVRLANSKVQIPTAIAGKVSGVVGVNEYLAEPTIALKGATPAKATPSDSEPAPPAGFRNAKPCSASWGGTIDKADQPALYAPFTAQRPYDICGYKPGQLRSAYQTQSAVTSGDNGTGVTIAIVDAYDSPTLLADAQKYATLNDPTNPLKSTQFLNEQPATVDNTDECAASGWYDEQSLDVESSHAMAPGANILYVGAEDCTDTGLLSALQTAVSSGANIVSDSWGDTVGDLFSDQDSKTVYDNTFELADSTGVSVLFSSGDDGDNFADTGLTAPDYPASSPFITAVGGTALKINSAGARNGEDGWSTGKQLLCTGVTTTNCGSSTKPAGPMTWNAGGGGGTSYTYTQPFYQAGVVPVSLSERNSALFGPTPLRVVPDLSMDADAQTGMLIGLTQTFPDGVYYDQFKEGGTSLATPLFAGVIADTDQAAGSPEGFLNPTLYNAYTKDPTAFKDIVSVGKPNPNPNGTIRVDYVNSVDNSKGYNISLRQLDYEGPETYCDGDNNCATRNVTLNAANGYDGLTGLGVIGPTFISELAQF
jgi:subtilase family serine protease